ncbi:putative duf1715 domain-containing protein [Erysiphe neolycopersici]|uniref:Putative duf1715 domain-containing protein n=1 Tax=Erysiphe neolycopersici TaxID=212602 RepID=A0A420HWB1_9PEZI|nr:putative duf1715 domain-containing protein [Erysiphe neolycopersici]
MGFGPFSEVLNLEQDFYEDGFEQGLADGEAAGKSEGRTLGLEKGFEKFCETGRLYGRSLIWANQLFPHQNQKSHVGREEKAEEKREPDASSSLPEINPVLSNIPNSQKLAKSIKALHALVEPETLSFENTEEAVSDFDDRIKRARAKFKLIEKLIDN